MDPLSTGCKHLASRIIELDGVHCLDCKQILPKLYPNRVAYWHKNMGPPEYYIKCCGGTGIKYYDGKEGYCKGPNDDKTCEAGNERRRIEGDHPQDYYYYKDEKDMI